MRHLIRNRGTHSFFHQGEWTPRPDLAQDFSDSASVIRATIQYHLMDVELILQPGDEPSEAFDIHLPLLDHPPRE